jgi:hypothetical protein
MLDGVFERGKNIFDILGQPATTLDVWPQRYRRRENQSAVQANGIEVVVKILPPTAVEGIARLPHTWSAVFPTTCSPDVRALLVGEKYVGTSIEALGVSLQAA